MEHVRQLEWPAIEIELVIVIVGVFIGMQVSKLPGRACSRVTARHSG